MARKKKKRKLIKRLQQYYRLVIMSHDNFEVKSSVVLTPMNLLFILSAISLVFIVLVASTIIFTPLKEYIPGYEYNDYMRSQLLDLRLNSEELNKKLRTHSHNRLW